MNRIYRKVWNKALGQVVVASELAHGHGAVVMACRNAGLKRHPLGIALAVMLASVPLAAFADDGVYINDGQDDACAAVHDDRSKKVTQVDDAARCGTADLQTQTDRVLFHGDGDGANSLSLGGELSVNSGRLHLGGANGGNFAIGDAASSASGGNAVALGAAAVADGLHAIALGTAAAALDTGAISLGDGSVAAEEQAIAIGTRSAAIGVESTAIGFQSNTLADRATALGSDNLAMGAGSLAVGHGNTATAAQSIAIGHGAVARGAGSIALGLRVEAGHLDAIAFGTDARALGRFSIAIGSLSGATSTDSTAYGDAAWANGMGALALGAGATVGRAQVVGGNVADSATAGTAVGYLSHSYGTQGTALGAFAVAGTLGGTDDGYSTAIGAQSAAASVWSVAIGAQAEANTRAQGTTNWDEFSYGGTALGSDTAAGLAAVATGLRAEALGDQHVAIGYEAGVIHGFVNASVNNVAVGAQSGQDVDGYGNIALGGDGATTPGAIDDNRLGGAGTGVIGDNNIGIGTQAGTQLTGSGNIALGHRAGSGEVTFGDTNGDGVIDARDEPVTLTHAVNDSVAIGGEAQARRDRAIAIGPGAHADVADSVALGSGSIANTAAGIAGHDPSTGRPSTNTGAAWMSTHGAASIGADADGDGVFERTRQLTGVAAGTAATDAVNVAQLNAVQKSATSHYVSINDGGTPTGNFDNDGASGVNSLAVGTNAASVGDDSAAVGGSSAALGAQSSAFGFQSNTLGDLSTALGGNSLSLGTGATAVGFGSQALGNYSFAGGYGASAGTVYDVAIGYQAVTDLGGWNVAMGAFSYSNAASVGIGYNAKANGANSVALGFNSKTSGAYGVALGWATEAVLGGTAVGSGSKATGTGATALAAVATAWQSTALGYGARSTNAYAVALGASSAASGQGSVAIGGSSIETFSAASASGYHSVALGAGSQSSGRYTTALGAHGLAGRDAHSVTPAEFTTSVGGEAWATENGATVVGFNSYAQAVDSTVLGSNAWTTKEAVGGLALGAGSLADRANAVSVGASAEWTDAAGVVHAKFDRQITNVAAGTEATDAVNKSQLDNAIAALDGDVGTLDEAAVKYDDAGVKDAVTLGGESGTSIHNLSAGTSAQDAVNFAQLSSVGAALGGGAGFAADGSFIPPSFTVQGTQFGTVGDAFAAIDGTLSLLNHRVDDLKATPLNPLPIGTGDGVAIGWENSHAQDGSDTALGNGATVSGGESTGIGANATIAADANRSVAIGADSRVTAAAGTAIGQGAVVSAGNAVALGQGSVADEANTVSVGSDGNERRVTHVAAATSATDAVNLEQMRNADASTLATARAHTDATATETLSQANRYTDSQIKTLGDRVGQLRDDTWKRLEQQDQRIDRLGAMSAAMMNMSINAANSRSPRGRVAVGAGWQNGETALSLGYSKQIGDRGSVSLGGAFSSDDQSVGVGFGIDL